MLDVSDFRVRGSVLNCSFKQRPQNILAYLLKNVVFNVIIIIFIDYDLINIRIQNVSIYV